MRELWEYLRRQRRWAALYVLVALIFAVVFYLHDLPPVALAMRCCCARWCCCWPWARLCGLPAEAPAAAVHPGGRVLTAERLPEAADALEEAYQALFKEALRSKALALDARDQRERAMTDYYTSGSTRSRRRSRPCGFCSRGRTRI